MSIDLTFDTNENAEVFPCIRTFIGGEPHNRSVWLSKKHWIGGSESVYCEANENLWSKTMPVDSSEVARMEVIAENGEELPRMVRSTLSGGTYLITRHEKGKTFCFSESGRLSEWGSRPGYETEPFEVGTKTVVVVRNTGEQDERIEFFH